MFFPTLDPCTAQGVCGPNAECSVVNHETRCGCPEGFQGNPSPQQGCVRVPVGCRSKVTEFEFVNLKQQLYILYYFSVAYSKITNYYIKVFGKYCIIFVVFLAVKLDSKK